MAVIVAPGIQSSPDLPSADQLVSQLRGRLTLSDVADSPESARYAVSSVDAANMPILQGVTPVAGMPWPSSAGVTMFNGRAGNITVNQLSGAGPTYGVGVSTPGSGVRIGNQFNLPPITAGNYQSGWNGGSITYTSTPTTAVISTTAAFLYLGTTGVPYNAASVNVTGTAGTTVTFYLYFNDPTYAGGAQTLLASTDPHTVVTSDGYVNFGQVAVTFPSSGSGGGGGSAGCPSVEAWCIRRGLFGWRRRVQAGRVKIGDRLLLTDGRWGRVTYSEPSFQPCLRLRTARGSFTCSASAPLRRADGGVTLAQQLRAGDWLEVRDGVERLCAVELLGFQAVQHITCEDAFFWCQDAGWTWFAHHNMKPPS